MLGCGAWRGVYGLGRCLAFHIPAAHNVATPRLNCIPFPLSSGPRAVPPRYVQFIRVDFPPLHTSAAACLPACPPCRSNVTAAVHTRLTPTSSASHLNTTIQITALLHKTHFVSTTNTRITYIAREGRSNRKTMYKTIKIINFFSRSRITIMYSYETVANYIPKIELRLISTS